MKLVPITRAGQPAQPIPDFPQVAADVGAAYVGLYRTVGHDLPWIGYFALQDAVCIGTCGFKGAPVDRRVEIAYYAFPGHEGRGHATRMARSLVDMAWATDPTLVVAAQTLPHESASTSILRKIGFTCIGSVLHPEDGEVWEWQKRNTALDPTDAGG